jgi:hypothetical protein
MIDVDTQNSEKDTLNRPITQFSCGRGTYDNGHYASTSCDQFSNKDSTLTKSRNWRPYVLHPGIMNADYATDAFRDIVYECTFCNNFYNSDAETGLLALG